MFTRSYFQATRSAWFSYLAALPLVAAYEVALLVANAGSFLQVRNGADAILDAALRQLGVPASAVGLLAVTIVVGIVIYAVDRRARRIPLRGRYYAGVLLESAIYALGFGTVVAILSLPLMPGEWLRLQSPAGELPLTPAQWVALSLGAGLYEELLFRVIAMGGLAAMLRAAGMKRDSAAWLAAIGSAVVFSAFHYVGSLADPFTWNSFVFRAMAGLVLAGLYVARGFAVAVYTHAFYDLFLLARAG